MYSAPGTPRKLIMEAHWKENGVEQHQTLDLAPGNPRLWASRALPSELAEFIPDYVLQGNQISSHSDEPRNPAIHLQVGRPGSQVTNAWVLGQFTAIESAQRHRRGVPVRERGNGRHDRTGGRVRARAMVDLDGVLAADDGFDDGVVSIPYPDLGHRRTSDRKGKPVLLLGGQPSKYRENFERKFHELTDEVEAALANPSPRK